jgi:site-specific recombinase XerD
MQPALVHKPNDMMVPAGLLDKAREYASASKADSTRRAYAGVWRLFLEWCRGNGFAPLPATAETVALYVAAQGDNLKPQTIKKHLAGISQVHQVAGHPSPTQTEPVRLVLQGLRRVKGVAASPRKALRVEWLRSMVAALPSSLVGVRDRAILLLGFAAGMRRSEIVGLDICDVVFEPEGAVVTIKRSKRDQEGKGRQVGVPRGQHEGTCPVRALQEWVRMSELTAGSLFVRLDPGGQAGERLDGRAIAHVVQRAARRAGLDSGMFSGHSLRRGFCTETARMGAAEREIARTTGHSSMAVLRGYVEAGTIFQSCAARVLDL